MGIIESNPASDYVTLFIFYFPEAGFVDPDPKSLKLGIGSRYVSASDDLTVEGSVYTAAPSLEFSSNNPVTGNVEPAEMTIRMSKGLPNLERLALPYPIGRITVEIREVVPGKDETLRTLFFGTLDTSSSKRTGRDLEIRCKCLDPKKFLKQASELAAMSTCSWRFGAEPCGYDVVSNTVGVSAMSILAAPLQNRVDVTLDSSPVLDPVRWKRGYLFNKSTGAKVMIRELVSANIAGPFPVLTLDLSKVIDPDWVNDVLLVVPGCDKQISTCRVHLREEAFSGYGTAMPGYNPTFYSN